MAPGPAWSSTQQVWRGQRFDISRENHKHEARQWQLANGHRPPDHWRFVGIDRRAGFDLRRLLADSGYLRPEVLIDHRLPRINQLKRQ
jgi:hypothetical protein